jgi:integrase
MITSGLGELALTDVKPSVIKKWTARLSDHYAASTIARCHSRLLYILEDAVLDGRLGSNPCSRRTSPPAGKPKMYCATTEQVWQLHDVMPERLQVAILLGAFAGLRIGEACGLRVTDVDFMRGVIHPKVQWNDAPLKTTPATSRFRFRRI